MKQAQIGPTGLVELFIPPVWVCGEPDDTTPNGICGEPVESEPCGRHESPRSSLLTADDMAAAVLAVLNLPARDATIRADERAKVRAELLAIAEEFAAERVGDASYDATGARYLADRIAPEPTPEGAAMNDGGMHDGGNLRDGGMHDPPSQSAAIDNAANGAERCNRCGGRNVQWSAPSPLWNEVMRGGSINGIPLFNDCVCPICFVTLAEDQGIASRWRLHHLP